MCNLYRMEDKDWVSKWAQDAESMINLMPAYQMNPDQMGPIVRNTADGKKQLVHARWGLPSPRFGGRTRAVRNRTLRANGMRTYAASLSLAGRRSDRNPLGI
ncbi:hypothetical protein GFPCMMHI_06429 [Ensifer adhaerens]|nr:hypothetical protein [Ensifer adhaerens]